MNSTQKPHPVDVALSEMACSCGRQHTFAPLSDVTDTTSLTPPIAPAPQWSTDKDAEIYPCADCGVARSINQGARIFAVCDECWEKVYGAPKPDPPR